MKLQSLLILWGLMKNNIKKNSDGERLYELHLGEGIWVKESVIFEAIHRNPAEVLSYQHLRPSIIDYDLKAIKERFSCIYYLNQTAELCLMALSQLQADFFILDAHCVHITIVRAETTLELILKLIKKQEMLDTLSGEDNLGKILTRLEDRGQLSGLSSYRGEALTNAIKIVFKNIIRNFAD